MASVVPRTLPHHLEYPSQHFYIMEDNSLDTLQVYLKSHHSFVPVIKKGQGESQTTMINSSLKYNRRAMIKDNSYAQNVVVNKHMVECICDT